MLFNELNILFRDDPMLLDKQFLACYIGYNKDKEIQDPNTPERIFFKNVCFAGAN